MTDTLVAPGSTGPAPQGGKPELAGAARPFLPLLVILFVGSGCAALIYEIVWLQMLGLVIGGSAISLGVLLGTFMGGMCIGSLLFPKIVSKRLHPLAVYGTLELLIGAIGLLELWLVPTMGDLYTHFAEPGAGAIAWRAVMAGICLLPPTVLMGATLPAIARYVESSPKGVSWLGFFYGANTVGAVFGCLLAGFYLLRVYDMTTATFCAAAINLFVFLAAIGLATVSAYQPSEEEKSAGPAPRAPGAWAVYVAIALSGLTGLGSEAIWTRQLSLMLGATVYTFSNILAVFLLGLAAGSSVGSFIARSSKDARVALAWCQFLLAGAVAWAAYAISYSLPFWPTIPRNSIDPWYTFQVNLAQVFWAVLPGALLWGASFPLALAGVARKGQDPGKMVGGVYAANTVGAIIGSLFFAMVSMQFFGSQNSQRLLVALCAISGLIAVLPVFARIMKPRTGGPAGGSEGTSAGAATGLVLGVLASVFVSAMLIAGIGAPNWGAVAWGRNSAEEMPGLYPGVLQKQIPLTAEENAAVEAAIKLGFKTLEVLPDETYPPEKPQWKVVYTLDNPADEAQVTAWMKDHEKSLATALHKQSVSADEYLVIREANSRGLRELKLVNGELSYENNLLPDDVVRTNQRWVNEHKADLKSALRNREVETGKSNIFAYDNNSAPGRYCVYLGEGMNVSVAVTYDPQGYRYFHGAGKVQASSNPLDMRLQRTLGHISALTNFAQTGQTPKDVLVVACGAGVTAGSFVPYDCNITIVDIESMVPRYVTPQFADVNHDVIPPEISGRPTGYKKTKVIIDDGRHFVRTTKQKFDVITSDPIDPWVKGCAALNTVEYYQMCKDHLNPGGIMALWIPFYESTEETSKSIIATFFKVFPNGIIWSNDDNGSGYDAVLFGSVDMQGGDGTLHLDIDKIQDYLDMPEHTRIKSSLREVGFGSKPNIGTNETVELLATYAGTAPLMTKWTANTERLINYDNNLRLQYVAGWNVNSQSQVMIFNGILQNFAYPIGRNQIFFGADEHLKALREILESTGRHDHSGGVDLPTP
jgi:predicted membrane-bound spermidine synthase